MTWSRAATRSSGATLRRGGQAAVELAICLPLLVLLLAGLWEVGRIAEVEQVLWNSVRESARDASLTADSLQSVASKLLIYLQAAEPTAFPSSHQTSLIAPVVSLPANTYGYTCWDNTANRELFTLTFADQTNSAVTDPTQMSQLDRYQLGVQVPYRSVAASPLSQVTGTTRLSATVCWVAMVDSPFKITPSLLAQ